jgi:hypothetical protein
MANKPKIQEIGETAISHADIFLKKKVEGITRAARDEKEWIVEVEVLERRAVPDSQDILGKYEFKFDEEGELLGYRRIELRRRADMVAEAEEV